MKLEWLDENRPFSVEFDDIYYTEEDGFEECLHTFVAGNHLQERIPQQRLLNVGELGFGTGLNFLTTWKVWKELKKPTDARLHFYSCEKFPLSRKQIEQALSRWPKLRLEANEFLKVYTELPKGFFTFDFDNQKVRLSLLIGDASESLNKIETRLDAWYLDGFAPKKNPEMWSEEITRQIFKLSNPDASFATYTCAGWVRNNLETAGFKVKKVAGFGKKREMLCGQKQIEEIEKKRVRTISKSKVIVVGAGIAGASVASCLLSKDFEVHVVDRELNVAAGASAHRHAISYPLLSAIPNSLSRFSLEAYQYFLQHAPSEVFTNCGLIQLPESEEQWDKWNRAIAMHSIQDSWLQKVERDEARALSGLSSLRSQALFWPRSGYIDLPAWIARLLDPQKKPGLKLTFTQEVSRIEFEKHWKVFNASNELIDEAPYLVLANAADLKRFKITDYLPLRKVRGQLVYLKESEVLKKLKTVLCWSHFLVPSTKTCLGATYDWKNEDCEIHIEDTQELLQSLSEFLSIPSDQLQISSAWANLRCSLPGQEPLIGEIDSNQFPGLFASTGFASRGSIYAPLAGEIIASMIATEGLPIESDLLQRFSSNRFLSSQFVPSRDIVSQSAM